MAQAYTPGLMVSRGGVWRRRRLLPIAGEVLVRVGDRVEAQDVVARTLMPGDAVPVNLARLLGVSPGELPHCLKFQEGEQVKKGDLLAESPGIFGLFRTQTPAPATGTLESISKVTGQVLLRGAPLAVEVLAYLRGTVVEVLPHEGVVIEAPAAFIQGIFGIGGEAYGELVTVSAGPEDDLTDEQIRPEHAGKVLVAGRRMTGDAIRKAIKLRVSAVIAGGMDDQDLREILGYDLGVAVTGTEKLGTSLIITEGFGEIAMARRTFDLLRSHAGDNVAVNGATQIRAGVMRPEILIPLDDATGRLTAESAGAGLLEVGVPVRIIREPGFGALGTVAGLPNEPAWLESGSKARVVEVQLQAGPKVVVPRANVELIEG
ncbi:hypothetical protein [Planctellipticum variicoloris]|uniref:hypothetical protein n=1 Tax=Planctellipticum variicoloris TaxID=3064265 RepID=UPI0030137034|nr:hypothetical protein SH412_001323 [Planctomycetaceae bacterium SH412]